MVKEERKSHRGRRPLKACTVKVQKDAEVETCFFIYRHSTNIKTSDTNDTRNAGDSDDEDFNTEHTNNTKMMTADVVSAIDQNEVRCSRCRYIMHHAQKPVQQLSVAEGIFPNNICEHCQAKAKDPYPKIKEEWIYSKLKSEDKLLRARKREKDTFVSLSNIRSELQKSKFPKIDHRIRPLMSPLKLDDKSLSDVESPVKQDANILIPRKYDDTSLDKESGICIKTKKAYYERLCAENKDDDIEKKKLEEKTKNKQIHDEKREKAETLNKEQRKEGVLDSSTGEKEKYNKRKLSRTSETELSKLDDSINQDKKERQKYNDNEALGKDRKGAKYEERIYDKKKENEQQNFDEKIEDQQFKKRNTREKIDKEKAIPEIEEKKSDKEKTLPGKKLSSPGKGKKKSDNDIVSPTTGEGISQMRPPKEISDKEKALPYPEKGLQKEEEQNNKKRDLEPVKEKKIPAKKKVLSKKKSDTEEELLPSKQISDREKALLSPKKGLQKEEELLPSKKISHREKALPYPGKGLQKEEEQNNKKWDLEPVKEKKIPGKKKVLSATGKRLPVSKKSSDKAEELLPHKKGLQEKQKENKEKSNEKKALPTSEKELLHGKKERKSDEDQMLWNLAQQRKEAFAVAKKEKFEDLLLGKWDKKNPLKKVPTSTITLRTAIKPRHKKLKNIESRDSLKSESDPHVIETKESVSEIVYKNKIIKKPNISPIRGTPEKMKRAADIVCSTTFTDDVFQRPSEILTIKVAKSEEKAKLAKDSLAKGICRYALSDRTFIENGWTLLPIEKVVRKTNVYRMRPAHPEFNWFEHNKVKGIMYYDTGEKLAEVKDNSLGQWFYRNGKLALNYYDAEDTNAQQRIVIFSNGERDKQGRFRPITILGMFDYAGNGVIFDHSGKIRGRGVRDCWTSMSYKDERQRGLVLIRVKQSPFPPRLKYNQTEGVLLDREIGPASHWKWHSLNDPPILQQVMIDTQMLLKDPRIVQLDTGLDAPRPDMNKDKDLVAIEFANTIKEKNLKLNEKFKPFQIKMKALKINENFSIRILDQASIYLYFRDGKTNLKLNLGMLLDNQEIIDTETEDLGEISTGIERLPAKTESLRAMQHSINYAQHFEKNRTEHERRLRLPESVASSIDRVKTLLSKPLKPPITAVNCNTANGDEITRCYSRKPSICALYYNNRIN